MGRRVNYAELAKRDGAPRRVNGADSRLRRVPIESVDLNPLNGRPEEDTELEQLAETIREHGVIQPLVVCSVAAFSAEYPGESFDDDVEWVALIGNRRLLASRIAGVVELDVIPDDLRLASMFEVMLIENGQRRSLPYSREAEAMVRAMEKAQISQRELARRIGVAPMVITHRKALLRLVPTLRAALDAGELTERLARQLGDFSADRQEEVVANGKPYRIPSNNPAPRRINAASPEAAAESIRKAFTPGELTRLIALLSQ